MRYLFIVLQGFRKYAKYTLASAFGNQGKPLANYTLRWQADCSLLASSLPITHTPVTFSHVQSVAH